MKIEVGLITCGQRPYGCTGCQYDKDCKVWTDMLEWATKYEQQEAEKEMQEEQEQEHEYLDSLTEKEYAILMRNEGYQGDGCY